MLQSLHFAIAKKVINVILPSHAQIATSPTQTPSVHLPLFICPNHMRLVIAQHLEIPYDEITVNIVLCMMSTQRHMINTWTRIIVVNEDCKQPIHGIAKSTAKELERISNSL